MSVITIESRVSDLQGGFSCPVKMDGKLLPQTIFPSAPPFSNLTFVELIKMITSGGYTLHSSSYGAGNFGGGRIVFVYINTQDLNADKGE